MPTIYHGAETPNAHPAEGLIGLINFCAGIPELVAEFNRLTGCAFRAPKSPIGAMVDAATGRDDHDTEAFARFVMEFVALPLAVEGVGR